MSDHRLFLESPGLERKFRQLYFLSLALCFYGIALVLFGNMVVTWLLLPDPRQHRFTFFIGLACAVYALERLRLLSRLAQNKVRGQTRLALGALLLSSPALIPFLLGAAEHNRLPTALALAAFWVIQPIMWLPTFPGDKPEDGPINWVDLLRENQKYKAQLDRSMVVLIPIFTLLELVYTHQIWVPVSGLLIYLHLRLERPFIARLHELAGLMPPIDAPSDSR